MGLGDPSGIPESEWGRLEELIASFEASWKRGERPAIGDFLRDDDPHRRALLVELVHTELEFRLKAGEPARVEEYLHRYPSLSQSRKTVLELIRAELSFRRRREPELAIQTFIDRFPEFGEEMESPKLDSQTGSTTLPPLLLGPKPPEPIDSPLPRRFGKYQLVEKIGTGTFGVVYRAWDSLLKREVAIKIPRPEALAEHRNIRAFLREARNAIDLRHPNIVAIHDAGPIEGVICIIRAYVEGTTLAEQIRDAPLAPEEAAAVMTLVAEALDHAHSKGIIHRDLKPSNILLDLQGQPHITDFGLAKRESSDSNYSMASKGGAIVGTPAYMSPEQARGEPQEVDARSDVFSAGVVFYELLTGSVPFRGRGRLLLVQIQALDPTPPRSLNDEVTAELQAICLKAIAKNPDDRYQTAKEMADELRAYLGGRATPPKLTQQRQNPRLRRMFRSIHPAIPAGLSILLILATALWLRAESRRDWEVETTERSYQALLDLARLAQVSSLDEIELRRPLVDRIWAKVESLAPSLEKEPALRPTVAEAHFRLAERARARGSDRAAMSHWVKATELFEAVLSSDPDNASVRENLAVGLANLAAIRSRSGDETESSRLLERALILNREVLDLRRRGLVSQHDDPDFQIEVAATLHRIAEINKKLGKPSELGEVESIALQLERSTTLEVPTRVRLANLELDLGGLQLAGQFLIKPIESAERALHLFQDSPVGPMSRIGIGRSFLMLARVNIARRRLPEARKFYRLAIEGFETNPGRESSTVELDRDLGTALFEYGRLLAKEASVRDAITSFWKSLQIRRRLAWSEPLGSLNLAELAEVRTALAGTVLDKPLLARGLRWLAIIDRVEVLVLSPGIDENRRELRRLIASSVEPVTLQEALIAVLGRLQDAIDSFVR